MPAFFVPLVFPILLAANGPRGNSSIDFNREIRPLLVEHCLACHGPDEKARKADLRLDGLNLAAIETDGGKLIVPGKPEDSELMARLVHADQDKLMPPPKFAKPLSLQQIELFTNWIRQGAKTSAHWAFVPPVRPSVPPVTNRAWVRNPIDAFILAKLESFGLSPEPEAHRARLLRRVSLDLTGLPPTPAEAEAYERDTSPDAYERAVDRLLGSPRYGERMALEWLDMARFADSNGFQVDSSRSMWPWRDWVINAYNRNLPFDQFTIQQIAGDMLSNPTQDQLIATGFQRNHRLNGEGGLIAEEWRVETVIDRVESTSLAWMGITAGCARCHDHKYDPLSQREFYQLFALFNNVPESGTLQENRKGGNTDPAIEVATPKAQSEIRDAEARVETAQKKVREEEAKASKHLDAWAAEQANRLGKTYWKPFETDQVTGKQKTRYARQPDGSWLAQGPNPNHETTVARAPFSGKLTAVRLVCLPDASLPGQSVGRFSNGNFVLSRLEADLITPGSSSPKRLAFTQAVADFSQSGWPIEATVGGDNSKGWAVDGPTRKKPLEAIFKLAVPIQAPEGSTLEIRLIQATLGGHNIGRFRLAVTDLSPEQVKLGEAGPSPEVIAAIKTPAEKRNDAQRKVLLNEYLASAPGGLGQAKSDLVQAEQSLKALRNNLPTAMVMKEGPPRKANLLIRGQYDRKGEEVPPGFPSMLPPPPSGSKADRLTLAQWLASPTHPLTARVWVNRAWERYFGAGICRTTDNLGIQAEYPTNPELLDWLACEFVEQKWDMKAMARLIVTSATYRQDSKVTAAKLKADPQNRLLARGARFRLPGEIIRDQALFVSGLLAEKIGGPSVRPYMPTGVWDETSVYGDLRNYKNDTGEGLYRKSIYTVWKRTAAPPTMLLFDAPNRETCLVRRGRTNTPLQALALLNEITYVEAARKLAERMMEEGGLDVDARLNHGFRLALGRRPSAAELEILRQGIDRDRQRFNQDPSGAEKLIGLGEAKSKPGLPTIDLAAYTLAANVLLNLDECVTRE